jgi:hypothetical protein
MVSRSRSILNIFAIMGMFLIGCVAREENAVSTTLAQRAQKGDDVLKVAVDEDMTPYERYEQIASFHNLSYYGGKGTGMGQNAMGSKMESSITISKDSVCTIVNSYSDFWIAERISISIDKNLKVVNAFYSESTHLENDVVQILTVENVILTLSKNPFHDQSDIHGRYTLLLKYYFLPSQQEVKEGIEPEFYYETFQAKFKIFSEEDQGKGYRVVMKEHLEIEEEVMKRELAKDTARIIY